MSSDVHQRPDLLVGRSAVSTNVLSRLFSWLDSWLDPGSFQSQVTIQFRETDGEVYVDVAGECSRRACDCRTCCD